MCRVCGQIERLTDRPAICRPARIHFNEGNLRRHMKSQQLRVEVSLNVVLMMKRKLNESLLSFRHSIINAFVQIHAGIKHSQVQQMGQHKHRQRYQLVLVGHDEAQGRHEYFE